MDEILKLFFDQPHKEWHVREISKIVGKSPTTVSKYLKEYEKEGILESERKLNHLFFKSRTDSRLFKFRKTFYNIIKIEKSGLIPFLEKEFHYPEAIVIFGSYVRGENSNKSDIDLFVVSSNKNEVILDKFEKKIGNPIQLFVNKSGEVKKMIKRNGEFMNNVLNGITLYGHLEVF